MAARTVLRCRNRAMIPLRSLSAAQSAPRTRLVRRGPGVVDLQIFTKPRVTGPVSSMLLSKRSLRRSVLCLLGMACAVCGARSGAQAITERGDQFSKQLTPTQNGVIAGPVASLLQGSLQGPNFSSVDILYIDAPTGTGATSSVLVGEDLNSGSGNGGLSDLDYGHIAFTGATNVVAALPVINGQTDYAFAITGVSTDNLCLYYFNPNAGSSDPPYGGGDVYPASAPSSCMTLPVPPQVQKPPNFTAIVPFPFTTGSSPQLLVEDSANDVIYVVAIGPTRMSVQYDFNLNAGRIPVGPGPIYVGDFNSDGKTDFILNDQTHHTATVFFGNTANGMGFTWETPSPYSFDKGVYSMLLQDMDDDGHPDMVVEGNDGTIEIFKGNADGTFQTAPEGGTGTGNSLTGDGGHLAAIDPNTLDILTATPIGLSVLTPQSGTLNYTLKGIYNIGPGRSSFALANFRGGGILDLAVNSPEGIAIAQGDGSGGFQTSLAYSALAPALGATVGQFRTSGIPTNYLDGVAATGATQAQLLVGSGAGNSTFTATGPPINTSSTPPGVPTSNLWSNILSGYFNGTSEPLDIAYSLTGMPPLPTTGTGLYVQYGNRDGTFGSPTPVSGASGGNTLYGESAVGYFDTSGIADIANADANDDDTLLGQQTSNSFNVGLNAASSNAGYNQVAAGYFKAVAGQTGNQDLVFQQGAGLVPFKNNGGGTGKNFTPMPALSGTPPASSQLVASTVLLTDVTDSSIDSGNGYGDIIALYHNLASTPANPSSSSPNWLYLWVGNGDGTFSAPYKLPLSRNYYLAAVGDMNGDGYPDLVLSDGYIVGILYNQGQLSSQNGRFVSDIPPSDPDKSCPLCGGEQQFLAGQGINSLSLVKLGGAVTPSLIVANGGASISNPVVLEGETPTPTGLTPNPPDINTGGITVLANTVTTSPVSGSLTSTPSTSNVGATFTMIATFSSVSGVAEPSGTVTFYFDGTQVTCSPPNTFVPGQGSSPSTATCVVPAGVTTVVGPFPISAVYSGDSNNSAFTAAAQQTIAADPTTTTLYLCVGPTAQCLSTGTITPPPPPFPTNLHMVYGQTFNGTATVTPSGTAPLLGNTLFYDQYGGNTITLCKLPTENGGTCPPNVGTGTQVGVNVFTSSYVPGTNDINGPSTSLPVTIAVTPDTVNATVVGSPSTAPVGQPVTLTATLAGVNAPLGTATSPPGYYAPPPGTVVFMNGTAPITCSASATLAPSASGVFSTATCTTSSLPVGTDPITVAYAGSLDFQPTTSTTPFNEVIAPLAAPSFTLAVTPNPATATVGFGTVLTVTVTAQNGFSEGVNLACGALPSETTCTFAPSTIAGGGGGQSNLVLVTTAPHSCGATQPYFFGGNGGAPSLAPLALPALAGLFALFIPGRRRWLRALLAMAVVAGLAQIAGCGTCTDLGTRPNTYTIQVIGTSAVTGEVQSQALTINATI